MTSLNSSNGPRSFRLNVGGTKYEVSNSLLDHFPDSMLRRLTSDTWRNKAAEEGKEIFMDRNGERFQYVLDYMRDGKVALPLSVPRAQLVADMEYFGIDYNDDEIILSVADPKDLFHGLARYQEYFQNKSSEIEVRYRAVVAEKLACAIASEYFAKLTHHQPADGVTASTTSGYFDQAKVKVISEERSYEHSVTMDELRPHLKEYGLHGYSVRNTTEQVVQYNGFGPPPPTVRIIEATVSLLSS